MRTISFEDAGDRFNDDVNCQLLLDKEQGTHFGCCCTCEHRSEVYYNMFLSNEKSLGFYVCTAYVHMEKNDKISYKVDLIQKHGVCELHWTKK